MKDGKVCLKCGKPKADSAFFKSSSSYHKDGLVPICRKCIIDDVYDPDTGAMDIGSFEEILRQVDKPFLPEVLDAAEKQIEKQYSDKTGYERVKTAVGLYFKNINSLKQYQDTTYSNSDSKPSKRKYTNDLVYYLPDDNFAVTEEMIRLFGEGYTSKEYQTMQRIYDATKQDYPNISTSQRNLLLRYVRFAAKEEIATSSDGIADAEKWSRLASDALKQLNSIDVQGGVTSFSEFFQKFEREKDITRILPRFKYRPNDAPDFIIWCYINYCRRLEGKPEVPYEDVYKFYDEKVAEYVKQYGDPNHIFTDDPTKQNREKIKDFITLPPDYDSENT